MNRAALSQRYNRLGGSVSRGRPGAALTYAEFAALELIPPLHPHCGCELVPAEATGRQIAADSSDPRVIMAAAIPFIPVLPGIPGIPSFYPSLDENARMIQGAWDAYLDYWKWLFHLALRPVAGNVYIKYLEEIITCSMKMNCWVMSTNGNRCCV